MALISNMEQTKVVFHQKLKRSSVGEIHPTINTAYAYTIQYQHILQYHIDNLLEVNLIVVNPINSRMPFKGAFHHPAGPLESTHDMRWLINQYYND